MNAGGPTRRQFEQTHWSTVMRAEHAPPTDARAALMALCQRFWYPVYAYLRCFGHGPEMAQEQTQRFLRYLFAHLHEGGSARTQGRFRQYLLARLREFLSGTVGPDSAAAAITDFDTPPAELESRFQSDNSGAASPEQAFQQSFALELLARALARLQDEARETGRSDMFEVLQPFLAVEPTAEEADALAQRLKVRAVVLAVALRRLRQRYRELIDSELADTVASADEMLAEQQALLAVLAG